MAANARPETDSLAVFDHVRLTDDELSDHELPSGVYRVVGTPDDRVTLLRVADADGRRAHTGAVHSVPRTALGAFEAVENPDVTPPLTATLGSQLDGFVWQLRLIARTIVDRPIPGTAALVLVVLGLFGDPFLPIPDLFDVLLFLAGVGLLLSLTRAGSR